MAPALFVPTFLRGATVFCAPGGAGYAPLRKSRREILELGEEEAAPGKEDESEMALAELRERVLLICKEQLVCLYEAAGFNNLGPSDVVHGQDPWILMGCSLPPSESAEA